MGYRVQHPAGIVRVLLLLLLLLHRVEPIVRSELAVGLSAPELFPFAVSLQLVAPDGATRPQHFCGGTNLGQGWILTAAHCVIAVNQSHIVAQLGGHELELDQQAAEHHHPAGSWPLHRYPVVEVRILANYNPITMVGDIALLRIAAPEPGSTPVARALWRRQQLKLPLPTDRIAMNGEMCYILGYGSEEYDGQISKTLRYGTVLALEPDRCVGMMGAVVAPPPDSGMFCAIGRADACRGDSGGGYVCRSPSSTGPFVLRGIISYGVGCGAAGTPGVYTDVAYYLHHYQPAITNRLPSDRSPTPFEVA
ncbi:serine protease hepsin-like [Anopheles aquasalis]|uniref:serine protease hepsin-like n=1 Tax=Anopheles aquasalis TaxID=42839 RepID=UPI00215AA203|nr:serine protease hepsin-like [Anopheles aquasalis]